MLQISDGWISLEKWDRDGCVAAVCQLNRIRFEKKCGETPVTAKRASAISYREIGDFSSFGPEVFSSLIFHFPLIGGFLPREAALYLMLLQCVSISLMP